MPPKRTVPAVTGKPQQRQQQSAVKNVIDQALAPENRSLVTAVGMFAVSQQRRTSILRLDKLTILLQQAGIAFLHSGWGEILLPPSV